MGSLLLCLQNFLLEQCPPFLDFQCPFKTASEWTLSDKQCPKDVKVCLLQVQGCSSADPRLRGLAGPIAGNNELLCFHYSNLSHCPCWEQQLSQSYSTKVNILFTFKDSHVRMIRIAVWIKLEELCSKAAFGPTRKETLPHFLSEALL